MHKSRATHQKDQNSEPQGDLIAAMLESGFYPKPPENISHKQTHISHIFLVDELVYKLKKAVRFSFLHYSTVAKRRHFLNEELRLNRRLAPLVYLEVLPVTRINHAFKLAGGGKPVDHVLVMRR